MVEATIAILSGFAMASTMVGLKCGKLPTSPHIVSAPFSSLMGPGCDRE